LGQGSGRWHGGLRVFATALPAAMRDSSTIFAQMVTAISMRLAQVSTILTLLVGLYAAPAQAFTDDELIDGFDRTVFGSEYQGFGWQSHLVKKYAQPVRLFVDDRSQARRGDEIARFVRTLPGLISGLDISVVESA